MEEVHASHQLSWKEYGNKRQDAKTLHFRKQNIGMHQNQHNCRIPKDRRAWEDLEVGRNIVFKTRGKQWACNNPSFDRHRKEITRLFSSGNYDVSSGTCTQRFTRIAGLIQQILQLQAQVTLKSPVLCHKWRTRTKSFARINSMFLQLKRWRCQHSSVYVAAAIMWLRKAGRKTCETRAEIRYAKGRGLCGSNPAILIAVLMLTASGLPLNTRYTPTKLHHVTFDKTTFRVTNVTVFTLTRKRWFVK
jgi:hypothetical protein